MTGYDNTNKGTIGKNARKETDNHPDITGSLNVGGVDQQSPMIWMMIYPSSYERPSTKSR